MESKAARKAIREKLILAGIEEISRSGPSGFSMRQAALNCNVSCATPYNYFENKESFISEIKKYISAQWDLLRSEIVKAYPDKRTCLTELAVNYVKYLTGNPFFRSVVLSDTHCGTEGKLRGFMDGELEDYFSSSSREESEFKRFMTRSAVYEIALMIELGELPNDDTTYDTVREYINKILDT